MNISDELIQEHSDMLKSLETRINDIKMMGTPFIIVEGIDDVGFYEKICEQTNIQAEVVPIQAILGYEGKRGCKPVIEATDIIEKEIEKDDDADKYMKMALGIVDGDARKYKGKQLPYNKVRLVLEQYSFECYFDNEELLKMFLKEHTYISKGLLTSELLSFIKASVSEEYRKVWYLGLEALKSICVEGYKGIIEYGDKKGAKPYLKNEEMYKKISLKEKELDEFSESIGVTPEKFKEIAHGKWLLQAYISAVFEKISNLQKYCKTGKITRCRNCLIHNDKKLEECEYRSRINFMDNNLEQFLYTHAIRDTETEYIYQRIEQLGN